jgi:hypothetical protein
MDHSVQQHLTPTFVRPKADYIEFFKNYSRSSYNAAKLYSYLVFHAQRNKPGPNPARLEVAREGGRWGERAYWWVQTAKDIAAANDMTVEEFRGAMAVLERAEVAEHQRGRYTGRIQRYYGKTIDHFRLGVCQRGNGLDAWPTVEEMVQMRIIPGCGKAQLSSCGKAQPLLLDTLEGGDTLEGHTQDATAQAAVATATSPVESDKAPGKTKASEPFLEICLSRKREFLTLAGTACLVPELTPADRDVAQRFEHLLTVEQVDPLGLMEWLTPKRFQCITLAQGDDAEYAFLWLGKKAHQRLLIVEYRQHLAKLKAIKEAAALATSPVVPTPEPEPTVALPALTEPATAAPVEDEYADMIAAMGMDCDEGPLERERCKPTPDELRKQYYLNGKKNLTAAA